MRILAGIALGIAIGAMCMLIEHLVQGIHPRDFWGIVRAFGVIGAIAGTIVGLIWEFASGPKRPSGVNPRAPNPDSPSDQTDPRKNPRSIIRQRP